MKKYAIVCFGENKGDIVHIEGFFDSLYGESWRSAAKGYNFADRYGVRVLTEKHLKQYRNSDDVVVTSSDKGVIKLYHLSEIKLVTEKQKNIVEYVNNILNRSIVGLKESLI